MGTGEVPTRRWGRGLEYATTTRRRPGEPVRRVDWKATARRGEVMLKRFYQEGGGALHVFYDVEAPGPFSHDAVATAAVNGVASAARRGLPVRVTAYSKAGVEADLTGARPTEVLSSFLGYVLDHHGVDLSDLDAVLEKVPSRRVREALRAVDHEWLRRVLEIDLPRRPPGVWALSRELREESDRVFVASSLLGDASLLLDLVDAAPQGAVVGRPRRPWVDARDLESAYKMRKRVEELSEAVSSLGGEVVLLGVEGGVRHPTSSEARLAVER